MFLANKRRRFSGFGLAFVIVALFVEGACSQSPKLYDYPPFIRMPYDYKVEFVPIIVVATINSGFPVSSPHESRWGNGLLMQLLEVTVNVENVIKGNLTLGENHFYFYREINASGPPRLGMKGRGGIWEPGDRVMFFLQLDNGYLRTICDTWRSCSIPVFSGAHTTVASGGTIERIAAILLTRGIRADDRQMARAIEGDSRFVGSFSKEIATRYLHKFSKGNNRELAEKACIELKNLGESCSNF